MLRTRAEGCFRFRRNVFRAGASSRRAPPFSKWLANGRSVKKFPEHAELRRQAPPGAVGAHAAHASRREVFCQKRKVQPSLKIASVSPRTTSFPIVCSPWFSTTKTSRPSSTIQRSRELMPIWSLWLSYCANVVQKTFLVK